MTPSEGKVLVDEIKKFREEHPNSNRLSCRKEDLQLLEKHTNEENINLKKMELEHGLDYIVKICMN